MIKIETDINEYLSCIINFIYNLSLSYNCAFKVRDFYFRAPGSLVVLSFPQLVSFSSVFPSL
jgi:hypothetical protein